MKTSGWAGNLSDRLSSPPQNDPSLSSLHLAPAIGIGDCGGNFQQKAFSSPIRMMIYVIFWRVMEESFRDQKHHQIPLEIGKNLKAKRNPTGRGALLREKKTK